MVDYSLEAGRMMRTRRGEKADSRAGFQRQGRHEGVRPRAREDHENEL